MSLIALSGTRAPLLTLLAAVITACGGNSALSPSGDNPSGPNATTSTVDYTADGINVAFRAGTTNYGATVAPARAQTSTTPMVDAALQQAIAAKLGVQLAPATQTTAGFSVNYYVSITKDGKPLTTPTNLTFQGPNGASNAPHTYKPGSHWDTFPFQSFKGSGEYTVHATINGKTIKAKTSIDANKVLPRPEIVTLEGTGETVNAKWHPVPGAKSYLLLLRDHSTGKFIAEGRTKRTSFVAHNVNYPSTGDRYELYVVALSWDITADTAQPHPGGHPSPLNAAISAKAFYRTAPKATSLTEYALVYLGETVPEPVVFQVTTPLGEPLPGYRVTLKARHPNLQYTPTEAVTDAHGKVSFTVTAPPEAADVWVDATASSPQGTAEAYTWFRVRSARFLSTENPKRIDRGGHSATTLPNGHVLILGGTNPEYDANDLLHGMTQAGLIDTVTRQYNALPSMLTARRDHTATLLRDGRVLVAGGSLTRQAEVIDSNSYTAALTGQMTSPRLQHTATLLADGRVLLAGGFDGHVHEGTLTSRSQASAEIFDPTTGTFTATGPMNVPRVHHTASLLPDGRVLIAGGITNPFPTLLGSAEIFDPTTGKFSPTTPLTRPRAYHTASKLPDGRVLLTGGTSGWESPYTTMAVNEASMEFFNPGTGAFTLAGSMLKARSRHTATVLPSGLVAIIAGLDNGHWHSDIELYDVAKGTSKGLPSGLVNSVFDHRVNLVGSNKVLVTGGCLHCADYGHYQQIWGSIGIVGP